MSGPTFLVVGGARCGTSALVEGLRAHPAVFVTDPKEPHYFAFHGTGAHFQAPGDDHTVNKVSVTDTDAYLGLYPAEPHGYAALGDASVSTMYYHAEALARVREMNPSMRLVVLLREPVSRAYSAHQYMRARGLEPIEDFLTAVEAEPERTAAQWHHIWHYTAMSRYADSLAAIRELFPPEQVGVWFYDTLNDDYQGTLDEVLAFIGAPVLEREDTEVPRVNISGTPRSRVLHAALTAATANPAVRSGVKRVTSYRFRERVRRLALARGGLDPAVHETLAPRFVDDLARLRPLVPGPVPAWLEGTPPT